MDDDKKIDVSPTKSFFIQTLVRDIQLIDAFLDLIDNSIDSYIENKISEKKEISINFSKEKIIIQDYCGGIKKEKIYNRVFRFGLSTEHRGKTIGVFGIGMKRAIFKMGKNILIESDDGENYFAVRIDEKWLNDEKNWELDFEKEEETKGTPFTKITITELYPNITEELNTFFEKQLMKRIKDTHSIFIELNVLIKVNGCSIDPYEFKFLYDDAKQFRPFHKKYNFDGVDVEIFAGHTAPKNNKDHNNVYGWYVFCNNRLVIKNDTSAKTGWGGQKGKNYHYPQDNKFLGLLFLSSKNAMLLPWHTTKEDIQEDSKVYRKAQIEMIEVTNRLVDVIHIAGKKIDPDTNETMGTSFFMGVSSKSIKEITTELNDSVPAIKGTDFKDISYIPQTTTIKYEQKKSIVKKVKKNLSSVYMTNGEMGKKTFEYYVKMEELNDE